MLYSIFFVITFIALMVFHRQVIGTPLPANYPFILGLGFALLFNIKKEGYRWASILLVILAIFLRQSWIGLICIGITYCILLFDKKIKLTLWCAVFLAFCVLGGSAIYKNLNTMPKEISKRAMDWKEALEKQQHPLIGMGYGYWSNMPEHQPNNTPDKLWWHVAHSDWLQLYFEFGALAFVPTFFLYLLPIFFIDRKTLINKTILASYLCLGFQACVDFPFHRLETRVLGMVIIALMYFTTFWGKECEFLE